MQKFLTGLANGASTLDREVMHPSKKTALLTLVLTSLVLVGVISDWPNVMRFTYTAFEDRGGTLIVQSLVKKGLRPAIDFYYPYGLLPIVIGRPWFAIFGFSIAAELGLMAFCDVLMAWGLARFALAIRAPRAGVAFLVIATPIVIKGVYLNVTHALEAVFLIHALAEHANGRRRYALGLVTACAFVKPSMAYAYGFILLLLVSVSLLRRTKVTLADWRGEFGPAIVTGVAVVTTLVCLFGLDSLLAIQIPTGGRRSYEVMGYGFFNGRGRDFWRPAGANLNYYLGTFAGAWLVATATLMYGGARAAARWLAPGVRATANDELIAVSLVLHLAFVCLFYGVAWDWINYAFLLILGVLSMMKRRREWILGSAMLIGMLLLVHAQSVREKLTRFRSLSPSPETAGLWASPSEQKEWVQVLKETQGNRPIVLKISGCAELLFPQFEGTEEWYLMAPMLPLLPEVERRRIESALRQPRDIVLTAAVLPVLEVSPFKQAISAHQLIWRGEFFAIYRPIPATPS